MASKASKKDQVKSDPTIIPGGATASAASPTTAAATNDAVGSSGPAVVEHVSDTPAKSVDGDQHALSNASSDVGTAAKVVPTIPAGDSSRVDNPAGILSTNKPESEEQSGAGNLAGPAGGAAFEASIQQALATGNIDKADELLSKVEADFRAACPNLSAAIDAWQAAGHENQPTAVRITAKIEGFRRANIAHSKAPSEYPLENFELPEQLEQLLGEPNLIVELI